MDFSISKGTIVIAYSGKSNGENAWLIADKVSKVAGKDALYITDLPAGTLILIMSVNVWAMDDILKVI